MFTLYVSRNCGISYRKETAAMHLDHLNNICKDLDDRMLRWYVVDETTGEHVKFCSVHENIIGTMLGLNS